MLSSSLFRNSNVPMLEQVLSFTQARHGVLAGNVANMNTPGYRTRDLSVSAFQQQLRESLAARNTGPPGSLADPDRTESHNTNQRLQSLLYHDDSDVSLEHQVTELTKNQLQHNLAIAILTQQMGLLRAAIHGDA